MTVNSLFLSYGIGERKWSALDASFEKNLKPRFEIMLMIHQRIIGF